LAVFASPAKRDFQSLPRRTKRPGQESWTFDSERVPGNFPNKPSSAPSIPKIIGPISQDIATISFIRSLMWPPLEIVMEKQTPDAKPSSTAPPKQNTRDQSAIRMILFVMRE
jgi:hypothetical protein